MRIRLLLLELLAKRRLLRWSRDRSQADLATFRKPKIAGNPHFLTRGFWYFINATIFNSSLLSLLPSQVKVFILKLFGAKVGHGIVIRPRVSIKSPWFVEIGDHVWIGEYVWIDNHTTVRIGSNSCISQGAYLFTGNHDWSDPSFSFFCKPVEIGEGVWVTAFVRVPPGSKIPDGVALLSE